MLSVPIMRGIRDYGRKLVIEFACRSNRRTLIEMSFKLMELVLFQADPEINLVGRRGRANFCPLCRDTVRILDNVGSTSLDKLAIGSARKKASGKEETSAHFESQESIERGGFALV